MQKTLGKPPQEYGKPPPIQPQELGFGKMGVEIPKILSDIGDINRMSHIWYSKKMT